MLVKNRCHRRIHGGAGQKKYRDGLDFPGGAGGPEGPSWATPHTEGAGYVMLPSKPSHGGPVPPGQVPLGPYCHH